MKPARNELCSCGSGKKYKKCCIDKPALPEPSDLGASPTAANMAATPTQAECEQIVILYNAGQKPQLEEKARSLIARYPQSGIAWKLWGATLQLLGQDALEALQKAAGLLPNDVEAHNLLGITLMHLGRRAEAEASYRRALQINPGLTATLCNLAAVLSEDERRLAEAEEILRRVLSIHPNMVEAHHNLSALLMRLNQLDAALQSALSAVRLKPDFADAHFNAGLILNELKRTSDAETCFRNTLLIQANHVQANVSMGNLLTARGDLVQAEDFLRSAIQHNPLFTEAHVSLSIVLFELRRYEEAEAILRLALQVKPNDAVLYANLGPVLTRLRRVDEAILAFQKALELMPTFAAAYNGLGVALKLLGLQSEGEAAFRQAVAAAPQDVAAHSNLLSTFNFSPDIRSDEAIALARSFDEKFCLPHRHVLPPPTNNRDPQRRLRIGYVSPDFRRHAVAYYLEPILANHDKSVVEIFCYAEEKFTDEFTERFRKLADHWRPTRALEDDQMARMIRDDQIDILIDLVGHTEDNRLLAFARKPAPIQMTYLGYPGTTGLSAIDYRIADHHALPPGVAESFYTERVKRMPDSLWCYRPTHGMPDPSPSPALANGYVTFGSFNNFNKIDQPTLDLWADLLGQIPHSRLVLVTVPVGEARERLTRQFQERGIAATRLTFHGKLGYGEFHEKFQEVDISLDPLNVNGATTSCESLWMGVPVISFVGERFLTRAGFSLLNAAGAPEFAVHSLPEYCRLAIELATDLPRLASIRTSLRKRVATSALTNEVRFTRNLENLYREVWQEWCN